MARLRKPRLAVALALVAAFALGVVLPSAFGRGGGEPTAHRTAMAQTSKGLPKKPTNKMRKIVAGIDQTRFSPQR